MAERAFRAARTPHAARTIQHIIRLAIAASLFVVLFTAAGCGRDRNGEADVDELTATQDSTPELLQQYRQLSTSTPTTAPVQVISPTDTPTTKPNLDDATSATTELAPAEELLPKPTEEPTEPPPNELLPQPTADANALAQAIATPEATLPLPTLTPTSPAVDSPLPTPTDTATPQPTATPTSTPSPSLTATPSRTPTPSSTATPSSTPTITPTPAPPVARDVEFAGYTLMRLALSSEGFDSTGRPVNVDIEPRKVTVGGETQTVNETWCLQIGLVHELFDLDLAVDPYTQDLLVTGSIALVQGFCPEEGEPTSVDPVSVLDTTPVELTVPSGATATISYNLQGQRSLFGVSGLLDSDTGVIVELQVTHKQPQ